MIRYIITRNAWGDDMKAETSIVPELILPFEGVKAKCREIDVDIIEPKTNFDFYGDDRSVWTCPCENGLSNDPDAALFIDCPSINDAPYTYCIEKQIPFLLLITENLYLQPNKTYAEVGKHAAKILSYEANPLFPEKTVRLRYPVLLKEGLALRRETFEKPREYLLGMIASFKSSDAPGSLYAKRANMAFLLQMELGKRFMLRGSGWPSVDPLPVGLMAKHEAYFRCEFALVMENNNSIPGYVTEKIFNALIAGCIPIYEYCDNGEIPPECFVDASKFNHPLALLAYIEKMSEAQKILFKRAGWKFLEEAKRFSSELYVETIFSEIQAIL